MTRVCVPALMRCFFVALVAFGVNISADAAVISVTPSATYLRTNSDPSALDASPIDLAALGYAPGSTIRLQRLGDFNFGTNPLDQSTVLLGVFSSSTTLLANTQLNRVAGAIEAGTDALTSPTGIGGLPTDIAEDFGIEDVTLQIPAGAAYLFVTGSDSFYGDNTDAESDFAVQITPEPASLALIAVPALLAQRRRRGHQL